VIADDELKQVATVNAVRTDADTVSLTYVWKVNGTTRQTTTTTALTDTFDLSQPGNGNNGETVSVTVTPNDGTVDGSPATDSATVGNAAPVVDSVSIDQASPRTNDMLSATVVSHDTDGDTLTTTYQWTRNGTDIAGATDDEARATAVAGHLHGVPPKPDTAGPLQEEVLRAAKRARLR